MEKQTGTGNRGGNNEARGIKMVRIMKLRNASLCSMT